MNLSEFSTEELLVLCDELDSPPKEDSMTIQVCEQIFGEYDITKVFLLGILLSTELARRLRECCPLDSE
jgi:hypothetical protein